MASRPAPRCTSTVLPAHPDLTLGFQGTVHVRSPRALVYDGINVPISAVQYCSLEIVVFMCSSLPWLIVCVTDSSGRQRCGVMIDASRTLTLNVNLTLTVETD